MKQRITDMLKLCCAIITLIASPTFLSGTQAVANGRERGTERTQYPVRPIGLRELGSIDELKAAFQHDAGKVRIVALVSPT